MRGRRCDKMGRVAEEEEGSNEDGSNVIQRYRGIQSVSPVQCLSSVDGQSRHYASHKGRKARSYPTLAN